MPVDWRALVRIPGGRSSGKRPQVPFVVDKQVRTFKLVSPLLVLGRPGFGQVGNQQHKVRGGGLLVRSPHPFSLDTRSRWPQSGGVRQLDWPPVDSRQVGQNVARGSRCVADQSSLVAQNGVNQAALANVGRSH